MSHRFATADVRPNVRVAHRAFTSQEATTPMVDTFSAAGTGGDPVLLAATVSAQAYLAALAPIMTKVAEQTDGPVQEAADLIVASLRAGGVVQAFGSGHSEALAMEIAGRAGGLVPDQPDRVARRGDPRRRLARGARQQAPRT